MATQTAYNAAPAAGFAGMRANSETSNTISRLAKVAIGFGVVAVQGTADNQVTTCADANSAAYRGITLKDTNLPPVQADAYAAGDTVAVMEKGVIWVVAGATVTKAQPVYYVPATGVITNASSGNTAIPNAIFDSSAASGALVKVRLR